MDAQLSRWAGNNFLTLCIHTFPPKSCRLSCWKGSFGFEGKTVNRIKWVLKGVWRKQKGTGTHTSHSGISASTKPGKQLWDCFGELWSADVSAGKCAVRSCWDGLGSRREPHPRQLRLHMQTGWAPSVHTEGGTPGSWTAFTAGRVWKN